MNSFSHFPLIKTPSAHLKQLNTIVGLGERQTYDWENQWRAWELLGTKATSACYHLWWTESLQEENQHQHSGSPEQHQCKQIWYSNKICDDSYDLTCGGSTDVHFNIMRRNVLMFAVQVAGLFLFLLDPENRRLAKDHMKGKLTFFLKTFQCVKKKSENIDEKW